MLAFSTVVIVAVAALWVDLSPGGLASTYWQNVSRESDSPIARVDAPPPAEAPEAVAEVEERPAEEDSTGEKPNNPDADEADKKATEEAAVQDEEKQPAAGEEPLPPAPSDPTMYLTVPRLGLVDNTVYNDSSPGTLDVGAAKLPETGFPWQDNANPYIAGHRVGYGGTESYYQFYNLPSMVAGDEIILEDANGSAYTYRVSDVFAVTPQDTWVTVPEAGRDMITLQTCVASLDDWWTITPGLLTSPPGPGTARLIVQADRVDVQPA